LEATDGKMRETDVADTQSLLRIIQSIPSPKAEPFKQWLAKVGYERIQEIQDPEMSLESARENWQRLDTKRIVLVLKGRYTLKQGAALRTIRREVSNSHEVA
jgi:hypothetical protein